MGRLPPADRGDRVNPAGLRTRDLRRLVRQMWADPRCGPIAPAALDAAIAADAKSCDRAVITGYLDHFPFAHPHFERLVHASALAARRRDWPWRERGERWRLWDGDEGPTRLARALMDSDDPAATLRDAGLDGDLAEGEFVAEALDDACEEAATARGERAVALGERLAALFGTLSVRKRDAALIDGLLRPWIGRSPDDAHKRRVGTFLVGRYGDPRIDRTRWAALGKELAARETGHDPEQLISTLSYWLTDAAVRAFFSIVGRTVDRKDQWAAREAFWLGYLDKGVVIDGWFAFGREAERLVGARAREEALEFGRLYGGNNPGSSALVLSIGDLRIAEWSDNGACRFWPTAQARAVEPYLPRYDWFALRTTSGGPGFDYLSHTGFWQAKFARKVFRETGVTHPIHGQG